MNRVELLGRLTRDPEIKDLGGNNRMARFTLAVKSPFRTAEQNTDFISCVCFAKPALNAEKYLKQGMLIAVEGWLRTGRYKNKDGVMVFTTEVQVDKAHFAESKKQTEERMREEAEEAADNKPADPEIEEIKREDPVTNTSTDDWLNVPDGFDEDSMPFS